MNNLIELKNINKSFDNLKKIKVLKKISYKFRKGKIYSLMGPSGSGKSTLLNLISLIDRPNSGTISIEKKIINFTDSNKNDILRANRIGIIYQQDNLLPDFTALENIYLASLAGGNKKELSITKAKTLLKKVKLLNRSNHYPSQLSGGEKQRVSIARALINDPQIILADEPTGSLDLVTAKEIFKILKNQINPNRLIIFATHNRFFANKADCLLEMIGGNIKSVNARV
jgi:ABC-type lipoprotein export system ATPase subunit